MVVVTQWHASLAGLALSLGIAGSGYASETVVYSFSGPYRAAAYGRLLEQDSATFYGTAYQGTKGSGSVFELSEKSGQWSLSELHNFGGSDGLYPLGGVVQDPNTQVLYGTTTYGGSADGGVVFSLAQSQSGWTETVLHSFTGSEGLHPRQALLRDKATGVFYGTAPEGGTTNCGTVFQIDPTTTNLSTLYSFAGANGCRPDAQLRAGTKAGTLIGASDRGGDFNKGTIFELSEVSGKWKEAVLYSFTGGRDGRDPADLAVADDGTIYGVTQSGGALGGGVLFQLSKPGRNWEFKVLYNFGAKGDGKTPIGLQLEEKTGSLYGATYAGGAYKKGTLFEFALNGSTWRETVLHSFGSNADGAYPISRPVVDATTGQFYGTTLNGGAHDLGTVYAVAP